MEINKDDLELLIDFINDLAEDEFYTFVKDVPMKHLLRHGECFEFAKTLQYLIPSSRIYYSEKQDHFAVYYNGYLYDAEEKKESLEDFHAISNEELKKAEDYYGHHIMFYHMPLHQALIQELQACSGDYVANLIEKINEEATIIRTLIPKEKQPEN